jgi:hypothetical protein
VDKEQEASEKFNLLWHNVRGFEMAKLQADSYAMFGYAFVQFLAKITLDTKV